MSAQPSSITPLMRQIMDVLDTAIVPTDLVDLHTRLAAEHNARDETAIAHAWAALRSLGMVSGHSSRTDAWRRVGPIFQWCPDPCTYTLTETGCDALWALMKAEAGAQAEAWANDVPGARLAHRVHFESRAAMREFLRATA